MSCFFEDDYAFARGYRGGFLAGVDEVGRGPLVGSVVAAAVILDPDQPISGLADSKKLSEKKRLLLSDEIKSKALAWSIAEASIEEIDRLSRAVKTLSPTAEFVLVDGNRTPKELDAMCQTVVKGDAVAKCISAASILAKVWRDNDMVRLDAEFPGYGIAKHKGYPTPAHLSALQRLGPTAAHRKSFGPVARILSQ